MQKVACQASVQRNDEYKIIYVMFGAFQADRKKDRAQMEKM